MTQDFWIANVQFPGLNEIIKASKAHPMAYSTMKKNYAELVRVAAKQAKLRPMTGPVTVHFSWAEKARRRDPDNIRAGSKFILDALVKMGVLETDSLKTVQGLSDTFTVSKAYGVHVILSPVEAL